MGFRSLDAKKVSSRTKINTLDAAKDVMVAKLQDNITAWNDNKGANLPAKGGKGANGKRRCKILLTATNPIFQFSQQSTISPCYETSSGAFTIVISCNRASL